MSSHVLRWAGNVGHVGKEEMLTEFWWRKLMLRDNFERPRRRWDYDIKMDFKETRWGEVDVIQLASEGQLVGCRKHNDECVTLVTVS